MFPRGYQERKVSSAWPKAAKRSIKDVSDPEPDLKNTGIADERPNNIRIPVAMLIIFHVFYNRIEFGLGLRW